MFNINFTSKAVIVATIFAVISFSALEAKAENDWSNHVLWQPSDNDVSKQEIQEYLENQLSKSEVNCLARNVYFESRDQPDAGQVWVAWVTVNRKNSELYPDNICSVVHQCNKNGICQFSWVRKNKNSKISDQEAWNKAHDIAVNVLIQEKFGAYDPTLGSTMFHANYVKPSWRHDYIKTAQIGNHIFYR